MPENVKLMIEGSDLKEAVQRHLSKIFRPTAVGKVEINPSMSHADKDIAVAEVEDGHYAFSLNRLQDVVANHLSVNQRLFVNAIEPSIDADSSFKGFNVTVDTHPYEIY